MLAKQRWRLIQRPNSLGPQVLKMKYFPESIFFHAKLGNISYFIWSILEARHLIEEDTIQRIGSGEYVKIWKDKWIPHPTLFEFKVQ